jgi:transposase-like protein
MRTTKLSAKESVYCPTCKIHSSQSRGSRRGTRYCGVCGNEFSLEQSRIAHGQSTLIKDALRHADESIKQLRNETRKH